MPITTTCPGCKALFRLPEELAGKPVRCQKCAQMFTVPMPLSGLSAPAVEAPVLAPPTAPVEALATLPKDDVILAALAPEAPPQDDVVLATLAEPSEPEAGTKPPLPSKRPPLERPISVAWTLALLALFLVALLATGGLASIWVATHLAPPLRLTAAPMLNAKRDFPFDNKREDGPVFMNKDDLNPVLENFGQKVTPEPLDFGFDGRLTVNGRTQEAPGFNHGKWNQDGPYRLYRVRLTEGVRYNFLLSSPNLQARLRVVDGDVVVLDREDASRFMVSYQPAGSRDYLIWVRTPRFVPGNFDLTIVRESRPQPTSVDMTFQASFSARNVALRLQDPLDANQRQLGPYREYEVTLEANKVYVFRVDGAPFLPALMIDAEKNGAPVLADAITRSINHTFRAPAAGKFRVRVAGQQYALGNFTLHILHKTDPITIIAQLDENGKYEDARAMTFNDPLGPEGLFKTYLVELEGGQTYVFDMKSNAFKTRLDLFNPDNNRIGTGLAKAVGHSQIAYTAARTGSYRLQAAAVQGERGPYTFTISRKAKNADDK